MGTSTHPTTDRYIRHLQLVLCFKGASLTANARPHTPPHLHSVLVHNQCPTDRIHHHIYIVYWYTTNVRPTVYTTTFT